MTEINPIMVETLAKMTGKTQEEVLRFLEHKDGPQLKDVKIPLSVQTNQPVDENAKSLAIPKGTISSTIIPDTQVIQDEVITEEVPLENLTEQQLQEAEEENNIFSDTIRVGSKVRVTWEPNVGKGKIKWVGKVGTVIQKLSDSGVSVFLVEFPAGKIPFQRVNKKTGKLEKGYHTKKLQQWLDENNIELVF